MPTEHSMLNVAILEPYYGGSHKAFVDAYCANTRHHVVVATMAARKWKWRMRGAAAWFARMDRSWTAGGADGPLDAVLCSDMMSVADLRAMLPPGLRNVRIACYFHENQLTYPLPDEQTRDFQYGMTNITSCLSADAVWFNSAYHRDAFLDAAGVLLRKMPDYGLVDALSEIRERARVLPPPIAPIGSAAEGGEEPRPFTILWPHRWEYDKNPEPFVDAVLGMDRAGVDFRLVLLGERFRCAPAAFSRLTTALGHRITHLGFEPDTRAYHRLLRRCDLVVSTAIQENFGIAVAEAILAGCRPLLPNRLSYPELIPPELHAQCLFDADARFGSALTAATNGANRLTEAQMHRLRSHVQSLCGAREATSRLDDAFTALAAEPDPDRPTQDVCD